MLPMVSVETFKVAENYSEDFKSLLNTLKVDEVGDYLKTDKIILLIGARSFAALKRKKDKKIETKKSVRAHMRLTARVYLAFRELYSKQSEITIINPLNNAADM